jgi:hypothetical protein
MSFLYVKLLSKNPNDAKNPWQKQAAPSVFTSLIVLAANAQYF